MNTEETSSKTKDRAMLVVVLAVIGWFISIAINGNLRQDRLDHAVDKATSDASEKYMQQYLNGESLDSIGFAAVAGRIVSDLKKQLPAQVDDDTFLIDISIGQGILRYVYSVHIPQNAVWNNEKFKENGSKTVVQLACTEQFSRMALANGMLVIYSYQSNVGRQLSDLRVSAPDCNTYWSAH
jgi:hypothetical protein